MVVRDEMGIITMMDWILGLIGSACIALLAYWKRSLSQSGALAAVGVGTVLYAWGSLPWFGTLLAFFISSSILSKWKQKAKEVHENVYEKSGKRDAGQVLANGGAALCLCIAHHFFPHHGWWAAFLGIMASVNADTWATEIGGLSTKSPRSILTGKKVPPGTSGGVTPLGLLAALCGSLLIGACAWLFVSVSPEEANTRLSSGATGVGWIPYLFTATVAGVTGALADSLLGARLQVMYRCSVCGKDVERILHCGKPTVWIRGVRWMNNDMVNFLSSLLGGLVALWLG
ncbi:hypothetical protein DNHGIG_12930 [Collibacillus ludicampi]|uniref:DUF92 domain-containing protein n=2 Tax=Collibacillus ludicampi TaxID=2771369 RepID=A0AAV4LDF9_9BACL|nr:hypothetical protein DNHGIG_12930 [Collibacillus ludicampi]